MVLLVLESVFDFHETQVLLVLSIHLQSIKAVCHLQYLQTLVSILNIVLNVFRVLLQTIERFRQQVL